MKIRSFFGGGFCAVTYLVTDDGEAQGVLVDPAVSYDAVRREYGVLPQITAILLTHGHFDHILTLDEWREKTHAPVCICREDGACLTNATLSCYRGFLGKDITHPPADRLLTNGDTVSFGDEVLTVMQTPGHTPGSCVYVNGEDLLTGDTLFAEGGYGRYDLPGGSYEALRTSLAALFRMADTCRIYPGHGGPSTIGEERKYHGYFK